MIISQSRRFIFVHVMKAGGTSITNDLCRHLDWRDVVLGGTPLGEAIHLQYKKHLGIEKHSTAREILDVVGVETWNQYFTFSFVRHPYTRAVSLYNFIARFVAKRQNRTVVSRMRAALGRGVKLADSDWLTLLPETGAYIKSSNFSEFIRLAADAGAAGMRTQADCLADASGRIAVDFVGKTENLAADLNAVLRRIGLPETEPSHENRSAADRPWQSHFRGEGDFTFLARAFEKDFELFGYDPGLR
jgi:hypothetical protein